MTEYYVVRDKNTGLYFRGKGVNRWGKCYNQASIYRVRANAENTIKEVSWRGEQAEVVPIQIIESTADVVPKSEVEKLEQDVARLVQEKDDLIKNYAECMKDYAREIFEEIEKIRLNEIKRCEVMREKEYTHAQRNYWEGGEHSLRQLSYWIAELKKKYTEKGE